MRTITAAQQAVLDSLTQGEHVRLSVKDVDGNWRDLTVWPGFDALKSVTWTQNINEPHMTFDAKVARELYSISFSPYVEGSPLNHAFDPEADFAPILALTREVKIEVAIVPNGMRPAAGDWMEVFRGRIDSIDAASGPDVAIGGRDLAGRLAQQYIKLERVYAFASDGGAVSVRVWESEVNVTSGEYGIPSSRGEDDPGFDKFLKCDTSGVTGTVEPVWTAGADQDDGTARWDYVGAPSTGGFPVEDIIQNILDDNIGQGDTAPTLYTPVSPSWDITMFMQQRGFTYDAVRALATQIGWDVRERWKEADTAFALTLYEPERDDPDVLHTFSADDYEEPSKLSVDIKDIRNSLKLIVKVADDTWPDGSAKRKEFFYSDPDSIDKYGELWSEIQEDETKNIDTEVEADRLGAAFISDCSEPTAQFGAVLTRGFPWVELNDFYTFEADGRRSSVELSLAVTSCTQAYEKGGHLKTALELRGKPTIGHEVHLAKEFHPFRQPKQMPHRLIHFASPKTVNPEYTPIVGGFQVAFPTAGGALKEILDAEYEVHVSDTPGFTPDDTTLVSVAKATGVTVPDQVPEDTYYSKTVPRWYNAGQLVRGQPTAEKTFKAGQAQADHLKQEVEWGRLPLNGGFETRRTGTFGAGSTIPDHWATTEDNVEVAVGSADAYSGDGKVFFNNNDSGPITTAAELYTRKPFTIERGVSYELIWAVQSYLASFGGAVGKTSLIVRWLDYAQAFLSDSEADFVGPASDFVFDSTWQRRSGVVTAPDDARFAQVVIKASELADAPMAVWIDSVRLERA